jgi:hypothetical protein
MLQRGALSRFKYGEHGGHTTGFQESFKRSESLSALNKSPAVKNFYVQTPRRPRAV